MPSPQVALVPWFRRRRRTQKQFIFSILCGFGFSWHRQSGLEVKKEVEKKRYMCISGTQSGTSISRSKNGAKHTPIHSHTSGRRRRRCAVLLHSS